MEGRDKKDYQPDMPPLDGPGYLIDYLYEIGPVMAAGMGAGPISHQEILAWRTLTGIPLEGWESRLLRRLSVAYLNESRRAEKLGCEPPWKSPDHKPEPSALQMSLRALAEE